jgi:hypothetical protein
MDEISLTTGIQEALDALYAGRLALLCGAGLSMAPPSSLPSAVILANNAKTKYDAFFGATRPPLAEAIDEQAQFFFDRGQLDTVYLRTYVGRHDFAAPPNAGHLAVADFLLNCGITTAVSTNVDTIIETAGDMLFGHVGAGISRSIVGALPYNQSPLLKIHGCWSDPSSTIWARGQLDVEPFKTRILEASRWLEVRLLDRDILIVGYWTDWDYLNEVLERVLGTITPSRVMVVDPCETASFAIKAPALFALGQRATGHFYHIRSSGADFLDKLRTEFSQAFARVVRSAGREAYRVRSGRDPDVTWFQPSVADSTTLWRIRRDLEGCKPNQPSVHLEPIKDPVLGMTILQLCARGATEDGQYWKLDGTRIRVLRAANEMLHEIEAAFARETAPAIAADLNIAVGAESVAMPASFARGSGGGTISRGSSGRWLSRPDAERELAL